MTMFNKLKTEITKVKSRDISESDLSRVSHGIIFGNLLEEMIQVKNLDRRAYLNDVLPKFFDVVKRHIHVDRFPTVRFLDSKMMDNTFGLFHPHNQTIEIVFTNRHPVDSLRTLAHELVHWKQLLNNEINQDSGSTGSPQENEANSLAGVIMRDFNQAYPECLHYE